MGYVDAPINLERVNLPLYIFLQLNDLTHGTAVLRHCVIVQLLHHQLFGGCMVTLVLGVHLVGKWLDL